MALNSNTEQKEDNASSSVFDSMKTFYILEEHRVESFLHWPFKDPSSCSILNMAQAGFYWSGSKREPDTATCFVCNKTLDGWEKSDDPWKEHAKHAPQCEFVKGRKKETEITIREFINITKLVIKNKMTRNLEKTKAEFLEECTKELQSHISSKH